MLGSSAPRSVNCHSVQCQSTRCSHVSVAVGYYPTAPQAIEVASQCVDLDHRIPFSPLGKLTSSSKSQYVGHGGPLAYSCRGTTCRKHPGPATSLWPCEGARRRPNRAAMTPIGQQYPPGPLKLLVLQGKICKNTDFYFAQITTKILVYACIDTIDNTISRQV